MLLSNYFYIIFTLFSSRLPSMYNMIWPWYSKVTQTTKVAAYQSLLCNFSIEQLPMFFDYFIQVDTIKRLSFRISHIWPWFFFYTKTKGNKCSTSADASYFRAFSSAAILSSSSKSKTFLSFSWMTVKVLESPSPSAAEAYYKFLLGELKSCVQTALTFGYELTAGLQNLTFGNYFLEFEVQKLLS